MIRPCKIAFALLLLAPFLAVHVLASSPGERPGKSEQASGVVLAIDSDSITIDDGKGAVTFQTPEDYTGRVASGVRVTVWHHTEGRFQLVDRVDFPLENTRVPPGDFIPRIKKVILLPGSNAGDAEPIFSAIEQHLRESFGWKVSPRVLAEEIRRRAMKEAGKSIRPAARRDGTPPAPLEPADPELIRRIAEGTRADAVLEVRIEYVSVPVKSHTAEWDGAREKFGSTSGRVASAITFRPLRGELPASTAVLKLYDPEGQLLWGNRRGFRVLALQAGMGKDLRERPLTEAAEDAAFLDAWLKEIFASWNAVRTAPPSATANR